MRHSILAIGFAVAAQAAFAQLTVIPYPQRVVEKEGVFVLPGKTIAKSNVTWKTDAKIPHEGYRLSVTPSGITAWSSDEAGAFYAMKTLEQIGNPIPCCEIEDAPRFPYRGFMFDEARHFLGKELVIKYLDLISQVKMNVFHWHLTDDEGWRLELKCHPEVHEKGSVRPRSLNHGASYQNLSWDNAKYGPFYYTHEDVKEVLAYAAARHITVVPEFDFPAHSRALFASHPEFTCLGPNETFAHPWTTTGPQYECFCAANEAGMKFIEDILAEICDLFPSRQIHIGGDEAPPNRWRECPKCRKLMKELGLRAEIDADVRRLQTRMTHRFAKFLADRGREAVAWDETLSKETPTNLVLQIWHHGNDARRAAEAGVDIVQSPYQYTYWTCPQNIPDDPFYSIEGENYAVPLVEAFRFDPTEGISGKALRHVRGLECCNWCETTWGWDDTNWKCWPRTFASAEVAWTGPRRTDFGHFLKRVAPLRKRLIRQYINAAPITVHEDPRLVAAEGYGKPAARRPSSVNGFVNILQGNRRPGSGAAYLPVAFLLSSSQPLERSLLVDGTTRASDKFSAAAFLTTLVPTCGPDTAAVNSPFGEIADTLCPDTDQDDAKFLDALRDYKAAFLIGAYDRKCLKTKALAEYVRGGGTLFVSADQVAEGLVPADLAGVSFDGVKKPCNEVIKNELGWRAFQLYSNAGAYSLYVGAPTTAKPLLKDARGTPATWVNGYGRGKVYTVACRRMMADEYANPAKHFNRLRDFASGNRVFPFIRYFLERVQNDLMPVTVTGDIQWGLNRVEGGEVEKCSGGEVGKGREIAQKGEATSRRFDEKGNENPAKIAQTGEATSRRFDEKGNENRKDGKTIVATVRSDEDVASPLSLHHSTTSPHWMLWMINNRGRKTFSGEAEEIDPAAASRVAVNLKTLKGAKVTELTPTGTAAVTVDDDVFSVEVAPCTVRTFSIEPLKSNQSKDGTK